MGRYTLNRKFSLLLVFLWLVNPLVVRGEENSYVYKDFSGGWNTKQSALTLPKNQAIIAENLRFDEEKGSISKRDEILSYGSADTTEAITGMHRLYLKDGTKILIVTHGDEIETGNDDTGVFTNILDLTSGGYNWQWLTWNNIAIGTDGYNQPVKYDGSSASATYLGSCLATDSGTNDADGPDGVLKYKVIFYTTSYTIALDVPSNTITVDTNKINLTMIPIGPDTYGGEDITGRKIYRTGDDDDTYVLLSNGTIADNSTVILTDSDKDGDRSGAYPTPTATHKPPKGRFPVVNNNRLFLANVPTTSPSRIYYSEDANPNYFIDDTAYFNIRPDDGDEITFAKNLLGILTIGKNNTIQKLYTDGATPSSDWEISDPFSFIGCQAPYSAVNTTLGITYLTFGGLYNFNGQYSTLISDQITPEIYDISESNFGNAWGVFHRNIFRLAYTSEATGATGNDRILVYDLLSKTYALDILSISAFCTFNSGSDWGVLYSGSSSTGAVYAHAETLHEVMHKKHADFSGTFDDARYIPTAYGGDANDPVIELAWDLTIDDLTGNINSLSGDINRPDTDGSYISPVLQLGASAFDKLYWNESIPGAGGDVTFNIRATTSDTSVLYASWSSDYTDPTGSDISSETANDYVQYKMSLDTTNIDYTPNVYKANNYVVKLTYNMEGTTTETSIPFHWKGGWNDFSGSNKDLSAYDKELKGIYLWYESEGTGTLTVTFENYEGYTDTFEIDLVSYPNYYADKFTTGVLAGKMFNIDITEDSLNDLKIKKLVVTFDVAPLI